MWDSWIADSFTSLPMPIDICILSHDEFMSDGRSGATYILEQLHFCREPFESFVVLTLEVVSIAQS
jgi:hypothetical protein